MKWQLPNLTVELIEIAASPGAGEGRQIAPPRNGKQLRLSWPNGVLKGYLPATPERLAELEEVASCQVD